MNKAPLHGLGRESHFLQRWLNRQPLKYLRKYQNACEIIRQDYETFLASHPYTFAAYFNGAQRLDFILLHVKYVVDTRPKYLKFLKLNNLKDGNIGFILGYKNHISWSNSYKRKKMLSALLTLIDIHEKTLQRIAQK